MNSERCARPACGGKAAAWLAYDYEARCAWVDDQAAEGELSSSWPLCRRHADGLKVPRGWFSIDRRAMAGRGVPGPTAPGPDGLPPAGGSLTSIL